MLSRFLGLWWVRSSALFFVPKEGEKWGVFCGRVGLVAGLGSSIALGGLGKLLGMSGWVDAWDFLGGWSVVLFAVTVGLIGIGALFSPAEEAIVPSSGAKSAGNTARKRKQSRKVPPQQAQAVPPHSITDDEPTIPLMYGEADVTIPLPANYRFDMLK